MNGVKGTIIVLCISGAGLADAISFGEGSHAFEIEFVTVGNPGNPDDPRREYLHDQNGRPSEPLFIGGVDYEYSIAKFELDCRSVELVVAIGGVPSADQPLCRDNGNLFPAQLDFNQTTEFVNWLNTSSGYPPAYDGKPPLRNPLAKFFIANGDEFHKAAFYDPEGMTYFDYATGSNVRPTPVVSGTDPDTAVIDHITSGDLADVNMAGGLSAYGTMAQSGNAPEWEDGYAWLREGVDGVFNSTSASNSRSRVDSEYLAGLRIVAVAPVPEPSSSLLLMIALTTLDTLRRRRR